MERDETATRTRRARRAWALGAVFLVLLGADLFRSPEKQWSAAALLTMIDVYQATVSPVLARSGVSCRFTPTCSRYSEAVIARDGALLGTWRTLLRLGRCGPWTPAGSVDPA